MSATRTLRITRLRQRIECGQYTVDVDKVAEAMLGRSTTRILILPCAAVARREAAAAEQEPELASDDVLEAA